MKFNKSLHVTDYIDDKEVAEVTKRYCAVETQAPEGYQKLNKPVVIEFKRSDLNEELDAMIAEATEKPLKPQIAQAAVKNEKSI